MNGQGLLKYILTESTEFTFFPYHTQLAVLFIFLFYAVMTLTCPIYICAPGVNPELKDNLIFWKGMIAVQARVLIIANGTELEKNYHCFKRLYDIYMISRESGFPKWMIPFLITGSSTSHFLIISGYRDSVLICLKPSGSLPSQWPYLDHRDSGPLHWACAKEIVLALAMV